MVLTPEQQAIGRRNFLRALAGTPALAALGAAAATHGPVRGGPVRLGVIGVGGQGRAMIRHTDPAYAQTRAICDINPAQLALADEVLEATGQPPAAHYAEWREMLEQEDLEAVIVAAPLWLHAEMTEGCLDAGKHVLCEKMMAWDEAGCLRMIRAAERNRRVLEVGYQRRYNPLYQAAYDGVIRAGLLGDVHHARLAWHRNANWRRQGEPPSPDYDPSPWGYPSFEHLLNWRLYWRYSQGLFAELTSHQINAANWFLGTSPHAVSASAGVHRYADGREVYDHVYATFEYPGGLTVSASSIESNALEQRYEIFFGTRATLMLQNESDAFLFEEGAEAPTTGLSVSPRGSGPVVDSSETRPEGAGGPIVPGAVGAQAQERPSATRLEISRFCAAVRVRTPLAGGADSALDSALACLRANEAVTQQARLPITRVAT